MPGDLWTGYLQAEAADVAEQEREEGKKKQRLEEQLQKLNMEGLRRTIDRDAREWEIEDATRAQREEMLSGLEDFLSPEQMAVLRLGGDFGDLSELEDFTQERYEPTPEELAGEWRIGAGLQQKAGESKETYGGWLREETTKTFLKDRAGEPAEREEKLTDYHQKFLTAWSKKIDEAEYEDTPKDRFEFFRKWRDRNVLPGYKNELGKRLGFYGQSAGVSGEKTAGFQPSGVTKEEDEFIEAASGREDMINWDAIAKLHPKWNTFYIKQKLGINE